MPKFLDTRGKASLAIAVCARCGVKYPYVELSSDPNSPGLRVCPDGCKDDLDPWRLSPRATEDITLDYSRPDVSIADNGPTPVYANQISGIGEVQQPVTWSATTFYFKGSTVTPQDVNSEAVQLPQNWFMALNAGISGTPTPNWTPKAGSQVTDGAVTWLNLGIYPN